mmetsp:Transcript_755/g.1296  ORF Transcript_755/g.1296 Transcript_755/m.1296 type:complete len:540 (-) Transcript_755:44-1663(-)
MFLFLVFVASSSVVAHVFPSLQDDISSIEKILQYNAQLSCGRDKIFTTIDTSITYREHESPESVPEHIARIRSTNFSGVILAPPTSRQILNNNRVNSPVYTFASKGFGVGIVNGTPYASVWALNKKPSFMLPLSHPMQNRSNCVRQASQAAEKPTLFYDNKTIFQSGTYQYLAILVNAVVHREGFIALHCGWIQQRNGCAMRALSGGRAWWKYVKRHIKRSHIYEPWTSVDSLNESMNKSLPVVDELFVIDTQWDYNYNHWTLQALPRLIRFLKLLRENKSIKIHAMKEELHLNFTEEPRKVEGANWFRQQFLAVLGIDPSRLVHGSVIARKVYLPREMECSHYLEHSMELKLLAKILKKKAANCHCRRNIIYQGSKTKNSARTILLQERLCNPLKPYTWRCFNQSTMLDLAYLLHIQYPHHNIEFTEEIGDYDISGTTPLLCSIQQYNRADITIGMHGAAMTNVMFLKPKGIVFEIVGQFDGRFPPVCGLYGTLAGLFKLHSYLYYYDGVISGSSLDLNRVVDELTEYYNYLRSHDYH